MGSTPGSVGPREWTRTRPDPYDAKLTAPCALVRWSVSSAKADFAQPQVQSLTEGRDDEWHRMIDANGKGLLNVTKAFTADLVGAGATGPAERAWGDQR